MTYRTPPQFSRLTPPGRGGIAVFVLRGDGVREWLTRLFTPWPSHREDADDTLRLGHLMDEQGGVLDEAVVARHGEVVEINIHGGPWVACKVADALERHGARRAAASSSGADPALPAAHRGWKNLAIGTELLEAVSQARSEWVVRALSAQWADGLSWLARETIKILITSPSSVFGAAAISLEPLIQPLRDAAERFETLDVLLRPREMVFIGPPNAGKSSLVNALVGRAVSLVHDQPGTTRDWVRELALLHGVPAYLTDTAGLWEQAQGVDAQAVARSRERAQSADVVVLCGPGQPPAEPSWLTGRRVVRVALQMDRFTPLSDTSSPPARREGASATCRLSVVTGKGLDEFKTALVAALGLAHFNPEAPAAFTTRQRDQLRAAAAALEQHNITHTVATLRQLLEAGHAGT